MKALGAGPLPVFERNAVAFRNQWWVLLSGVAEPILYLLGMGLGLGGLVGDVKLEAHLVSYPVFVAAGLMASSAMNGAIFESTFNFFFKMKETHTIDAMLYTPLRMRDVLLGEVGWSVARGGVYSAMFLVIALAFGTIESWWAALSLPSAILIAIVFSSMGTFFTTYVRTWADFDLMQLAILPMFMCSTTFFPLSVYPGWAHPIVQATPLYNGVALIRDLHTGLVGWHDVGHVLYLVLMGVLFAWLTIRRMSNLFFA
ncbi:MAG: ABC transporter permease [Acidimicrobiales bacterium]|jgi:lipooligosaccharide transport system permease protein